MSVTGKKINYKLWFNLYKYLANLNALVLIIDNLPPPPIIPGAFPNFDDEYFNPEPTPYYDGFEPTQEVQWKPGQEPNWAPETKDTNHSGKIPVLTSSNLVSMQQPMGRSVSNRYDDISKIIKVILESIFYHFYRGSPICYDDITNLKMVQNIQLRNKIQMFSFFRENHVLTGPDQDQGRLIETAIVEEVKKVTVIKISMDLICYRNYRHFSIRHQLEITKGSLPANFCKFLHEIHLNFVLFSKLVKDTLSDYR